jgi:predicted ArsR family transcriptional regulator
LLIVKQHGGSVSISALFQLTRRISLQEEIKFQVMRRLYETTDVSKRTLAKQLGISLGIIKFCFQSLVNKGWAKMQNFSQSKHKMGYGLSAHTRRTRRKVSADCTVPQVEA